MRPYDKHEYNTFDDELYCSNISKKLNFNTHTCSKRKCLKGQNKNRLFTFSLDDEEDFCFLMKVFIAKKFGSSELNCRSYTRSLVNEALAFYDGKSNVVICQNYLKTLRATTRSVRLPEMCSLAPQKATTNQFLSSLDPGLPLMTPTTSTQVNLSEKNNGTFKTKVEKARDVIVRKKISEMTNGRKLNDRLDDGLSYLIRIAGFNSIHENMLKK